MKTLLRFLLLPVVALATVPCLASKPVLETDDAKPVAVLSFASVDQLLDDLAYFTKTSGRNDVGGAIRLFGGSFLKHLDRTKPAGVFITIRGDEPKGIGFLPVPDLDQLLTLLKTRFGASVDELENGVLKLELGDGVFVIQKDEWLFFSDSAKNLTDLPADPVAILGGLEKEYGISFRLFVQNIPSQFRQMAIDKVKTDIRSQMAVDLADAPEIEAEFLEAVQTQLQDLVALVVNDSDQVTLGWAVDAPGQYTFMDFQVTAVEGSPLSKQFDWLTDTRSSLSGFLMPDAAATIQGSARVSSEGAGFFNAFSTFLRKKAVKGIDEDPNAPEALKEIVNAVLDVVDKTVNEGKTDVGTAVVLAPKSFKFVGGVRVADGQALAGAFAKLIELGKSRADVPDIEITVEQHQGIDLHTFAVPLPDGENDARKVLGENMDVVIGMGPTNLFFGFGAGSEDLLKAVIDRSIENGEKPVPPVHFQMALKPLFNFLASIDPNNEKLASQAEVLADTRGGDSISVTVTAIENGLRCRLRIEEGVLEMLGRASRSSDNGF